MYLSLFLFSCLSRKGSINVKISKREMFLKAHGANIQQWEAGLRSTKWVSQLCKVDLRHQMSTDNVLWIKTNISYRGQITVIKQAILSKEYFSVLPFVVFCGIISPLSNTVVFTLSGQSSLSISVQLRSSYISKRFIILCRLPGGQRSFHFDQEKKDHQHNHTK